MGCHEFARDAGLLVKDLLLLELSDETPHGFALRKDVVACTSTAKAHALEGFERSACNLFHAIEVRSRLNMEHKLNRTFFAQKALDLLRRSLLL